MVDHSNLSLTHGETHEESPSYRTVVLAAFVAFHVSPCQGNPSWPASGEAQVEVSPLVKAVWNGCPLSLPKDTPRRLEKHSPYVLLMSWVNLSFACKFPMGETFSMSWEFEADSWLELVSFMG